MQAGDDEITVKLRSRKGVLFIYRPYGRRVPLPSLETAEDFCEVRELSRLSDIVRVGQMQRKIVLVTANIFGRRAHVLREVKRKIPHLQVLVMNTADQSALSLLDEGLADYCLPVTEELAGLRVSMVRTALSASARLSALYDENERYSRQVTSDALTGLYNYTHIIEHVEREFKRAERSHESLSCILLDIDHFSAINDQCGLKFGDYVLHEISYILRLGTRQSDLLGRYGGEEFMILLPNTDSAGAVKLAEKLRKSIEDHVFRFETNQAPVTASFGFATNHDAGVTNPEQLLLSVERALAYAKESGRNRVCGPEFQKALSDSDIYRRTLSVDAENPVILLLTQNDRLRLTADNVAELENYQLLCFENGSDFLAEYQGYSPTMLIVDCTSIQYSRNFLRQLIITAREGSLPVILSTAREFLEIEADLCEYADDLLHENPTRQELTNKIQAMLKVISLERDLKIARTELKLAQKRMIANERLRAIGEMTVGFAAQLNIIFSNIVGPSQLLIQNDMVTGDSAAIVKGMLKAADEGGVYVRQIQKYLRPQRNEPRLHSAAALADDALQLTKPLWHHDAISTGRSYYVANHIPEHINLFVDSNDFKEILISLITNSMDAMPKGGALTIGAQEDDREIAITVSDTGQGMTAEEVDRLFDPTFTTKPRRGAGLGMQVVHALVKRHQGRIQVESLPKKGTTVRLVFARSTPEQAAGSQTEVAQTAEAGDGQASPQPTKNVLFADREKIVRDVYAGLLQKLGCIVEVVEEADALKKRLGESSFDVLFVDQAFPSLPGVEVASYVRELGLDTRIVLLSGSGIHIPEERLLPLNIAAVLYKPLKFEDLRTAIFEPESRLAAETGSST